MIEPLVAYCPAAEDGCSFYRMFMPHLRTKNSRYISEVPVPYQALAGYNVVIVQRLASHDNLATLHKFREQGYKVIYDLDDDMWAIQASNPAAKQMKNLKDTLAGFEACAELAHVITCATARLESSIKTNARVKAPIRVVNNAVDLALFVPPVVPRNPDKVTVGWGGSATHGEDLQQLGNSLHNLLKANKKAWLHFVGMLPDRSYVKVDRIIANGWVPIREYATRLSTWSWDVYLAPISDNRFNRSKSAIKMMEAGAMKIPCLASDVQPYREFVCHDKDLEWLLCRSPKDWEQKVIALVEDENLRKSLGEKCFQVVKQHYNMETKAKVWWDIYRSALCIT